MAARLPKTNAVQTVLRKRTNPMTGNKYGSHMASRTLGVFARNMAVGNRKARNMSKHGKL